MDTTADHSHDDLAAPAQQVALPLDTAAEAPIPYALTARARRAVAPGSLPSLTVVDGDADGGDVDGDGGVEARDVQLDGDDSELDDPNDTRASRARALRRAGVPIDAIAATIGVDPLVVRAWVDGVMLTGPRSRRRGAAHARHAAVARRPVTTLPSRASGAAERFEAARLAAKGEAPARIESDPAFACGLGLVTGLAEVDSGAVVLVAGDADLVAHALRWLVVAAEVAPDRVRVILRLGPEAPGDLARQRWAHALGMPPERIGQTRWRSAPRADGVEALVRIADPAVAGTLAGWRDAVTGVLAGDAGASVAF